MKGANAPDIEQPDWELYDTKNDLREMQYHGPDTEPEPVGAGHVRPGAMLDYSSL
jgi:hypothetical protein